MFTTYLRRELSNRRKQTSIVAIGLAVAIALVILVNSFAVGIRTAQASALESAPHVARRIAGAVYVSCTGRGGPHFGGPSAELQLVRRAEGLFIGLAPQPAPAVMLEKYVPSELMGQHMHLLSPPVIASVGSPKLLLEVADRTTLRALRPNLELIADWSALHQVNGCYAYCRTGESEYEGRNFNHLDPALEDSATGVAAGALAAHRQQSLRLHQGHVTQQPCLIEVQYSAQAIWVGGMVQRST